MSRLGEQGANLTDTDPDPDSDPDAGRQETVEMLARTSITLRWVASR